MDEDSLIHTAPEILAGEPVFVEQAGDSLEMFLDAFPDVTGEQAVAALDLARQW